MQNNKHYYLLNSKVMVSDSKMPEKRIVQHKDYNQKFEDYKYKTFYDNWLFYLQPCDIDESEFDKVKRYVFNNGNVFKTTEITDIVFEKYGKIYFKQPVEQKIELGDTIEYTIYNKNTPHLHGKTFRVKVASIDENNCYVYAPYGQDIIPISQAKLIHKEQPKQVEINDSNIDIFINKYINDLPKNWTSNLDMYLAMKNSIIEALSYPDKYTIKRNI